MKQKIKQVTILLFSIILIACNNNSNPKENNKSQEKSASLTNEDDTVIVIASINGGVPTFVADPNVLQSDWQNFITNQLDLGPCTLNHIEIISDGLAAPKYYLVVSGTMNSQPMKASIELEQGGPTCYMVSGLTVTCTTSDCASEKDGCVPTLLMCTPCSGTGKCTKTVSDRPSAIFPSITATTDCQN